MTMNKITSKPAHLIFTQDEWKLIRHMVQAVKALAWRNQLTEPQSVEWHLAKVYEMVLAEVLAKIEERPLHTYPFTSKGKAKLISLKLSSLQEFVILHSFNKTEFTDPSHQNLAIMIVGFLHHKQVNNHG